MLYVTVFIATLVLSVVCFFDLPKGISLAAPAPNIVDVTCLSRSLSSAVWSKFSISSASAIIEFAFVSDFRIRIRLRTLIASATSFDSSVFCVALIAAEGMVATDELSSNNDEALVPNISSSSQSVGAD